MEPFEHSIGRRLREVRAWRGLSLRATAELAGLSPGHVSNIERGRRRVDRRSTLEALAGALRVAPAELAEQPFPSADRMTSETHARIGVVEEALSDYELGEPTGRAVRPWPEVAAELHRLTAELFPQTDYAAQAQVVPDLIADLHSTYNDDPQNRRAALEGLMYVYYSAASLTKNQGVKGLPQLAAFQMHQVAEEIGEPQWLGFAARVRGSAAGSTGRKRQYELAQSALNELSGDLDRSESLQMYGMLHLNSALIAAAQEKADLVGAHVDEASAVAERLPEDVNNFANMYFGRTNVGIWRVSLGTELGEGGKVAEIAREVRPENIPSNARQAIFYADLGRALADERKTRPQSVASLVKAEDIAPQLIRNQPFVREAVTDLLHKSQHDTAGRELRGMAYRMGIAT